MVKEAQEKYLDALRLARENFSRRALNKIVDVSGAVPEGDGSLLLNYGGRTFRVTHPEGEITVAGGKPEIQISDRILILQYLAEVSGVAENGKWLSFLELPGGPHHYAPFKYEAIDPLARCFGSNPEGFVKACCRFGGKELPLGDKAYKVELFPRLPLAFVIWFADEEFPARANILFDSTASLHLNTAGLYMLGINAAEKLIDLV